MGNDPVLSDAVALQVVGPTGFLRNVTGDETGRILMVGASSVALNTAGTTAVSPSSTWTVTTSTGSIVGLTTTSVISYSSIPTVAFSTASVISTTTTSVIGLTTTSVVALTSSALAIGTIVASSTNTQSVAVSSAIALSSSSLTIGVLSTSQVITTTTTSTVGLTTTSLVALTSSALTIGVLSTTQVVGLTTTSIVANASGAQQIGTVALTSGSAIPISTVGSVTSVALTCSNATVQVVLAANLNRKGFSIQSFAASAPAYLSFASTSVTTTTSLAGFSISLVAGTRFDWTLPTIFTGGITGCAGLLLGSTIIVTEYT